MFQLLCRNGAVYFPGEGHTHTKDTLQLGEFTKMIVIQLLQCYSTAFCFVIFKTFLRPNILMYLLRNCTVRALAV